ncbi:hypothetical protein [Raoultibacter massiliensis]|uniref:DUF1461 domain-containing protein n=1 Tax=Raoultibacter massiliensis TaxID=1852371 RepID=A0ABV1JDM0_9ACTN
MPSLNAIRKLPLAACILFALSLACFFAAYAAHDGIRDSWAVSSTFVLHGGELSPAEAAAIEAAATAHDESIALLFDDAEGENPNGRHVSRFTTARLDADGFPVTANTLAPVLGESYRQIDYRLLSLVSYSVLLLYPLALGICMSLCCRRARMRSDSLAVAAASRIPGALFAIAWTTVAASALSVFGDCFPNRWSDFAAWGESAEALESGLFRIVLSADAARGEPALGACALAIALCVGAVALFFGAVQQHRTWQVRTTAHHGKTRGAKSAPMKAR